MIQKTRCRNCRSSYEIIWDDSDINEWRDDFEDDIDDSFEEPEDDPVYCPFCGTHCDYDE
jgi:hypothetical protein